MVCFANKLDDNERSDRVIATKWDTAFTLHDGLPSKLDIERLKKNKIICSLRNKKLRLSIAHFNNQKDIENLLETLN